MRERLTVLSRLALSPSSWSSSFVTVAEGDSREGDELALGSNCHGSIAECLARKEFELGTKTTRRIILAHSYYISDNALRRDNVPCSRLGASYYNCHPVVEGQPLLPQLLHHHPQTKRRRRNPIRRYLSTRVWGTVRLPGLFFPPSDPPNLTKISPLKRLMPNGRLRMLLQRNSACFGQRSDRRGNGELYGFPHRNSCRGNDIGFDPIR
ncbi:hypothetical protein BHM03_00010925 [Ensete ventricosum]|nr:hypothetical protein BHM03_00010925 [Ensete ventricosum]